MCMGGGGGGGDLFQTIAASDTYIIHNAMCDDLECYDISHTTSATIQDTAKWFIPYESSKYSVLIMQLYK